MTNKERRLIPKIKAALENNDDTEAVKNEFVGQLCGYTGQPYSPEDIEDAINHVLMFNF